MRGVSARGFASENEPSLFRHDTRAWSWLRVVQEDLVEAKLSLQGRVIDDEQE